jgi:hypothetical protein
MSPKDGILPTTVVASHHYPTMPSPGGNNTRWYQLIVVYLCGNMGGTKRRSWGMMEAAMMVETCILWRLIFVLVFCMLFYVETITVIAENRIISIININMF